MKILFFQTAFLGDLLLSTVFLKNLRMAYPEAEVHLAARGNFAEFFKEFSLVDKCYSVNKKDKESLVNLIAKLKTQSFDLVFCPHESFRSASICGKLDSKLSYSFRRWFSSFFFDRLVTRPMDLPDVLRQTALLAAANADFGVKWVEFVSLYRGSKNQVLDDFSDERVQIPDFLSMKLTKSEAEINQLVEKFDLPAEFICIAPGSVWETKKWREEHYVEFSKNRPERVFVLGGPGEEELCERVSRQIPGSTSLAGKTKLIELYAVLSKAKFLVCNDSGTMHMASCADCPSLANFGPTTLDIGYRPWSNQSLVNQIELSCRPCGKHGHQKCPIGTHQCMKDLLPSQLEAKSRLF